MTLISAIKKEGSTAEIKFSIAGADFKAEVEKVYRKQAANITIPGFRKGKAPRNMIEKMYGKGFFYEDAINNLLPKEYPLALDASGFDAVSAPDIDIEDINDEQVVVIATIKVKPEVTVDEYKGIEVTRKVAEVTAAEVEAELVKIIAEVGATQPSEMGKVMGVATKKLAGLADGRVISTLVKKLLSQN